MQETQVSRPRFLGLEDTLEKGMATRFSILAWRIPWREELGRLQSTGSQRVGHDWVTITHTHTLYNQLLKRQTWWTTGSFQIVRTHGLPVDQFSKLSAHTYPHFQAQFMLTMTQKRSMNRSWLSVVWRWSQSRWSHLYINTLLFDSNKVLPRLWS